MWNTKILIYNKFIKWITLERLKSWCKIEILVSKFGQINKDDIIIGNDPVDKKFLTACGPNYTEYHNCLKSTYGDTYGCNNSYNERFEIKRLDGAMWIIIRISEIWCDGN